MRTIAVVNRKGGSGKTTTAVSVAAALAERGLPILLIDLDPQASASAWLAEPSDRRGPVDAFLRMGGLAAAAVKTEVPGLQLVPSSASLLNAERMLKGNLGVEAHAIALPGVAAVVAEMRRLQTTLNPALWDSLIVACRGESDHSCQAGAR